MTMLTLGIEDAVETEKSVNWILAPMHDFDVKVPAQCFGRMASGGHGGSGAYPLSWPANHRLARII
jgi:hypothetical protein